MSEPVGSDAPTLVETRNGRHRPAIVGWDLGTPLPQVTTVLATAFLGVVATGIGLVNGWESLQGLPVVTALSCATLEVAWLRRWALRRLEPRRSRIVRWVFGAPTAFAVGGLIYIIGTRLDLGTSDIHPLADFGTAVVVAPVVYLIVRFMLWMCTFFHHYGRALAAGAGSGSPVLGYAPTALLAGIFIVGVAGDQPSIRVAGYLVAGAAIGGMVLLGATFVARVDGISRRRLRWAHVLVVLAPIFFWLGIYLRS